MDELQKLTKQFTEAAKVAGPSSYIPEVSSYSQAGAIEGVVGDGLSAGSRVAGQKAQEADQREQAAREAQARSLSNKMDPSKYRRERKADGGFAFYDPEGNEVGIDKYVQITGDRLADVLSDSENPIDQEYISDYKNMNDLAQALYNGDSATAETILQQNNLPTDMKAQELMMELIKKYPHLYGKGTYEQTLQNRGKGGFKINTNAEASAGAYAPGAAWTPN